MTRKIDGSALSCRDVRRASDEGGILYLLHIHLPEGQAPEELVVCSRELFSVETFTYVLRQKRITYLATAQQHHRWLFAMFERTSRGESAYVDALAKQA